MMKFEDLLRTAVVSSPSSFTAIVGSEGFAIMPAMPIILHRASNDNYDTEGKTNA